MLVGGEGLWRGIVYTSWGYRPQNHRILQYPGFTPPAFLVYYVGKVRLSFAVSSFPSRSYILAILKTPAASY